MAPLWPEEVDCFTIPHSRMKKLVNKYSKMVLSTNFADELHFKTLLHNLHNVFMEFKAHEQIENILIMKKLRKKLKAAAETSAAVCNCHSDNRLTNMLELVLDGYRLAERSDDDRKGYGTKLQDALDDFTQNFIPHMEEEEEIFQPMLMKYFSYEELIDLKAKVIDQHTITKLQKSAELNEYEIEKDVSEEAPVAEEEATFNPFETVPDEICLSILSYLNPQDLLRTGQVSQRFNKLTKDKTLWTRIHPVHWAEGNWTFFPEMKGGVDGIGEEEGRHVKDEEDDDYRMFIDEDADIDESSEPAMDEVSSDKEKNLLHESKVLASMVRHLLPHVGPGVKLCDLAFSKGISDSLIHKILKLCPNLETLDLTHTTVGDEAFKEYGHSGRQSHLRHLDLTGCINITDLTLFSLADAFSQEIPSDCGACQEELSVDVETEAKPLCSGNVKDNVPTADCFGCPNLNADLSPISETFCSKNSKSMHCRQKCCHKTSFTNDYIDTPKLDHFFKPKQVPLNFSNSARQNDRLDISSESDLFTGNNSSNYADSSSACSVKADCCRGSQPKAEGSHVNMPFDNDCFMDCDGSDSPTNRDVQCCSVLKAENSGAKLQFLSLNGCIHVSDEGLWALAEGVGLPLLHHLDLSGVPGVGGGLAALAASAPALRPPDVYYCDNARCGDPTLQAEASGCRNLQSDSRWCCAFQE